MCRKIDFTKNVVECHQINEIGAKYYQNGIPFDNMGNEICLNCTCNIDEDIEEEINDDGIPIWICDQCGYESKSENGLKIHRKKIHGLGR